MQTQTVFLKISKKMAISREVVKLPIVCGNRGDTATFAFFLPFFCDVPGFSASFSSSEDEEDDSTVVSNNLQRRFIAVAASKQRSTRTNSRISETFKGHVQRDARFSDFEASYLHEKHSVQIRRLQEILPLASFDRFLFFIVNGNGSWNSAGHLQRIVHSHAKNTGC